MSNPLKLLVTFDQNGDPVEVWVEMTDDEYAQWLADQKAAEETAAQDALEQQNADTIKANIQDDLQPALDLAAKFDAKSASTDDQAQAISICLHAIVRLAKAVYGEYDKAV